MLTRDDLQRCLHDCAAAAGKADVEVTLFGDQSGLTRFAANAITQNVAQESVGVTVRLMRGRRIAQATTNQLDPDSLRAAVRSAAEALDVVPDDRTRLPFPGRQTYRALSAWDEQTARLTPMDRAHAVSTAVGVAKQADATVSGLFSTAEGVVGLANTRGGLAWHASTTAECTIMARRGELGGAARAIARYVTDANPRTLAMRAVQKVSIPRPAITVDPGRYTVVLEPGAVANLLAFFSYVGFSGQAFVEGRSFACDHLGKRALSPQISITDDAWHPLTLGRPFDLEGMPRRTVPLVEKGVVTGVVHDRVTARRTKQAPTGHAVTPGSIFGPIPLNLVLHPGSSMAEELIASTDRGLLVTEFHYSNLLAPRTLRATGMTRNGTFWIERGRVRKPVRDLRYTEDLVAAFARVDGVGRNLRYQPAFTGGGYVVPALKLRDFHFTSGPDA